MNFIKKHKITLMVCATIFVLGYVTGSVMEARSFEQQMMTNVFSGIMGQKERMRASREASEKALKESKPEVSMDDFKESLNEHSMVFDKKLKELEDNILKVIKLRLNYLTKTRTAADRSLDGSESPFKRSAFGDSRSAFVRFDKKDVGEKSSELEKEDAMASDPAKEIDSGEWGSFSSRPTRDAEEK